MDRIKVTGGQQLNGTIPISGAKNAALPLMIASLLSDEPLTLDNVPRLADVLSLTHILENHGVDISIRGRRKGENVMRGQTIQFCAKEIADVCAPYEMVSKMRASFWVLGPLLARMGEAKVSLPGGCAIGTRPIDLYLHALTKLGADIRIDQGYVYAQAKNGLQGAYISFPMASVGATHVALMAATLAKGETILENAAKEPEISDLAECLIKMGAKIEGIGTSTLVIQGVDKLHSATHTVLPDRIETGTYLLATIMTGGNVTLQHTKPTLLPNTLDIFRKTGAQIIEGGSSIQVIADGNIIQATDVTTEPFPAFPTDLQAQFMALMTRSNGTSFIRETIFENRFMHVQELNRLGALITLDGKTAKVVGVNKLVGAEVMATDLRASVSLVIAGLAAKGDTIINRIYHLDRGFENLEQKLAACGALIERISD